MRISKFTTVLRKEGVYLLHNTLANSIIRVYGSECQAIIDFNQDGYTFKLNEANSYLSTLNNVC